jgi:signal recognition particle GTPase
MKEFMGGEDDDLKDRGFMDSDDEIDFSSYKVGKHVKDQEQEEDETQPSLFGRLASAFQNYTGNKTLVSSDLDPILQDFTDSLTDKNVSSEIAQQICNEVK